ncbi:MAG: PspA/IM30 family protein [Cytophagaceae bacterium]|nr:PspA/IM30 family protein [Cytophagaceae bacterium]MDW8455988.1 hypothetical protein [Cytophagaceae bacterium]
MNQELKPKSFWEKPEGVTGMITLAIILLLGGYGLYLILPYIRTIFENLFYTIIFGVACFALVYIILDPKFRNLIWFIYKSIMRWITGLFVMIDPIAIIETYIETLEKNLTKMGQQITNLRGQMRKLKDIIDNNTEQMKNNLSMASQAKEKGKETIMILKSRKAGRLQESNLKLQDLYKKMEILYRVLVKMSENSEVLLEDIKDQVAVKKMEREAIRASHSAMKSALSIIYGDKDKRLLFDQAMEAIADDVSRKVGEMERFMELSASFMESIDLQNGVYEEKGMQMLEQWEKEGISFLLGDDKKMLIEQSKSTTLLLDPDTKLSSTNPRSHSNQYKDLFNF